MKKKYKYYIVALIIILVIILSAVALNPPIEGSWNLMYKNPDIADFNSTETMEKVQIKKIVLKKNEERY